MIQITLVLNEIHHSLDKIVRALHSGARKRLQEAGMNLEVIIIPPFRYFNIPVFFTYCKRVLTGSAGLQTNSISLTIIFILSEET